MKIDHDQEMMELIWDHSHEGSSLGQILKAEDLASFPTAKRGLKCPGTGHLLLQAILEAAEIL
jgi:hypothetical protein